MKKISVLLMLALALVACENSNKNGQRTLSSSSGRINSLTVVVDNNLWDGSVGETIREVLAAPVYGLPQDEPLFSINQMPSSVFTDFVTKGRIILKIEKGQPKDILFVENAYAKPQKVVVVRGETNPEINKLIKENGPKIISSLKASEIRERQRRIKKSLNTTDALEKHFGATMEFPSTYRVAKEGDDFVWLRQDIKTGTVNIMVYQMPLNAINKENSTINDIIKIRDSVGKVHIEGPIEGSYMITEEAYTPGLYKTIIDNKQAFETRSTWELKNAFMAGPFINYAIEDKINNRYLMIEGFAFAPSVEKRDYMFELESIIKSLKIKS